jgi:hypothetical protein
VRKTSVPKMPKQFQYFGTKKKSQLTEPEQRTITDLKVRFSFWHSKQLDLLTFSINLLFTISVATAGFVIANQQTLLFKDKLICGEYSLTKTSLLVLTLSATVGISGLITRLNDFRLTKDIVAIRRRIFELENDIRYFDDKSSTMPAEELKLSDLISLTRCLGRLTWILFYIQVFLFILTVWIISLSV